MYSTHLLISFIHLSSISVTDITLPFSASQCRLPVWPDWLVREQLPWQVRAPWMGPALAPAPTLTAPRESERSPKPWKCLAKWGMRQGGGGWIEGSKESGREKVLVSWRKRGSWRQLSLYLSLCNAQCKLPSCIATESPVHPVTPSLKNIGSLWVSLLCCAVSYHFFACTLL